jgi:hypothetical protein
MPFLRLPVSFFEVWKASMLKLLVFASLWVASLAIPGDSVIFSVFPRRGSLYGGTELTILGANFQRENISGL